MLNNEVLHSYFADPNNFDKYYSDVQKFFISDSALTLNQLSQYLETLGYGPKTIELSLSILSKSDEERAKEKEQTKKIIKENVSSNQDDTGVHNNNSLIKSSSFADILKKEISSIKEEMISTKNADKLIELNKKLDNLINKAFQLQEEFIPTYDGLLSVANEFAEEYKISHPKYLHEIKQFWDKNSDNKGNFLPQHPSEKRKEIYWNSIASIVENYQDSRIFTHTGKK